MKVFLSRTGGIEEISKKLPLFDGGYCGMTKVDEQGLASYLALLDRLAAPQADGPVVENILGELAREKQYPLICDISGLRWLEVDDEVDYQNAERILRMVPRFLEQRKR
jgi:choline kinase